MTKIALLPIPGCVSFPGMRVPLHIFEPRYRAMIHHCLDNNIWLGVSHTESVIHEAKVYSDLSESLKHNQSTYKPCSIFSAGPVELSKELNDGRLLIEVQILSRFEQCSETQTLPYRLIEAREILDQDLEAEQIELAEQLREHILNRLFDLTSDVEDIQQLLQEPKWTAMNCHQFSMEIFGLLNFDSDVQQRLLEITDPIKRLALALTFLTPDRH